jgi:hypothetical protein
MLSLTRVDEAVLAWDLLGLDLLSGDVMNIKQLRDQEQGTCGSVEFVLNYCWPGQSTAHSIRGV